MKITWKSVFHIVNTLYLGALRILVHCILEIVGKNYLTSKMLSNQYAKHYVILLYFDEECIDVNIYVVLAIFVSVCTVLYYFILLVIAGA